MFGEFAFFLLAAYVIAPEAVVHYLGTTRFLHSEYEVHK